MLPSVAPATRNWIACAESAWPSRFWRISSSAVMRSSLIWPDVAHAGCPRGPARPGYVCGRGRHQHQPGRARDWLYHRTPATPRPRRRRAHRRPGVSRDAAGPAARGADRRGDPRGSRAAGRGRPGGLGPRFARRKAAALTYFTRKEFTPGAGAKFLLYWTSSAGWPRFPQTVVCPEQVGIAPPELPWSEPS